MDEMEHVGCEEVLGLELDLEGPELDFLELPVTGRRFADSIDS